MNRVSQSRHIQCCLPIVIWPRTYKYSSRPSHCHPYIVLVSGPIPTRTDSQTAWSLPTPAKSPLKSIISHSRPCLNDKTGPGLGTLDSVDTWLLYGYQLPRNSCLEKIVKPCIFLCETKAIAGLVMRRTRGCERKKSRRRKRRRGRLE